MIVLGTALELCVKGSLSLLHLGTHDTIRLLIGQGSGMTELETVGLHADCLEELSGDW